MKNTYQSNSQQSTTFLATVFGVVVTVLLFGGYEVTQSVESPAEPVAAIESQSAQPQAVTVLEPIVITAKRG